MNDGASTAHRRVAVIIVTYNSERDLRDCFGSLRTALQGRDDVAVIVVDNASGDSTAATIEAEYPWATLVRSERNLGFASGNNLALAHAARLGCEFVYLLNPDTEVRKRFLDEALAAATARPDAGAVQSLLLLHDRPDLVNTAGNEVHFLGFGYCGSFRKPTRDVGDDIREITFASGACTLYRMSALERVGNFDDELFLYQEDMDLGWRLRLAGWRSVLAPRSVVLHKYRFSQGGPKYYFLERNRLLVLLKNLRWRTLFLLSPFLLAAEVGLLAYALRGGWITEKLRANAHFMRAEAWRHVRRGREAQARLRTIEDAEVARMFTPVLEFEGVTTPLIRSVLNPVTSGIWRVLRSVIR